MKGNSRAKSMLTKTVPVWMVALIMVGSVGVSIVAAASISVIAQNSAQQRAVIVTAQNLNDVSFTELNLVSEPYTAAPQVSSATSPTILTGNDQNVIVAGPGGQGYVQGDVAVQLGFNYSANPDAVIEVTAQYLYSSPGSEVWQATTYVELASGMAPTNFTVSVDLGLAYVLSTTDITMKALPYMDPLPGTPLISAPLPAPGSTVVVDPVAYVTNDVDSGYFAYWAIDNYTLSFEMWKEPNGTYFYVETYVGTATTYGGIVSPGAAKLQAGTVATAYVAYFSGYASGWVTGTFSPSVATNGFLGIYDFGGSVSNLGTSTMSYSGSPPSNLVTWVDLYFSGPPTPAGGSFALAYFYQGQVWVDANNVPGPSSGNILIVS